MLNSIARDDERVESCGFDEELEHSLLLMEAVLVVEMVEMRKNLLDW